MRVLLITLFPCLLIWVGAAIASAIPGTLSVDAFPPNNTTPSTSLFPDESNVGYAGPTATGAEGFAYETAPAQPKRYSKSTDPFTPLVLPVAADASLQDFSPIEWWGNLSPRRSLPAGTFGLDDATPIVPEGCEITQVQTLFRHGSRYPSMTETTSGFDFGNKIAAAAKNGTFKATGPLKFLNTWNYKLGYEILNTYGRFQCYQLGVTSRLAYGHLLNQYTAEGALPVFRADSQDRMVETMESFAQGFFGRNAESQYSLELEVEGSLNATSAPVCPKSTAYAFSAKAQVQWELIAFNKTAKRLAPYVQGFALNAIDVNAMIASCAYETISLGYSDFCSLFTEEEYLYSVKDYAYTLDLLFYYGYGPGTPSAAAVGKGWVQEMVARLTNTPISQYNSTTNSTLDSNPQKFPLNQSFYADATHDAYVSAILTAMDFKFLNASGALPLTYRPQTQTYLSSQLVPFNTNLVVQKMTCSNKTEPQIRFMLNDAVLPQHGTFAGCGEDADGLCDMSTAVGAIQKRLNSIDFGALCG